MQTLLTITLLLAIMMRLWRMGLDRDALEVEHLDSRGDDIPHDHQGVWELAR